MRMKLKWEGGKAEQRGNIGPFQSHMETNYCRSFSFYLFFSLFLHVCVRMHMCTCVCVCVIILNGITT